MAIHSFPVPTNLFSIFAYEASLIMENIKMEGQNWPEKNFSIGVCCQVCCHGNEIVKSVTIKNQTFPIQFG